MANRFSRDEMMSWTRDLYGFGFRRPGSAAGRRAEDYLYGLMKGFGLAQVSMEPVPFQGWFHDRCCLTARGTRGSVSFQAEPIVYTGFTEAGGLTAPLVDVGGGSPAEFAGKDLKGKIVLVSYVHGFLTYDSLQALGYYLHDPDRSLTGKGQVMSWVTEEERRVYQAAVDGGAIGFIGIFPLEVTPYLCFEGGNAFSGRLGKIPGLALKKSQGERLRRMMSGRDDEATIILTGETRSAMTHNIVGLVPGKTERVIQVTSHHDSMWLGATEDAAGVAVVLALAKTLASTRPQHTLAFVLEGAECLFVLGSRGHIGRHRAGLISKMIVDLHIEHLAREYVEGEEGRLIPTGAVQPRGMFVTDAGPLVDIVKRAVIRYDLRRTILLPTATPLGVPTDATAYNAAGLPVVSFISPPLYWNALEDTLDKVAVEAFEPTANAYADIIAELMAVDPDSIRKVGPPGDGYMKT